MKRQLAIALAACFTAASVFTPGLTMAETMEEETGAMELQDETEMLSEDGEDASEESEGESWEAYAEEEGSETEAYEESDWEEEDAEENSTQEELYEVGEDASGIELGDSYRVGESLYIDLKEYDENIGDYVGSSLVLDSELPEGLTFDPETGVISGTPQTGGIFPINVIFVDGEGSWSFELGISSSRRESIPRPEGSEESEYTIELKDAVRFVPYGAILDLASDGQYENQFYIQDVESGLPDGMDVRYFGKSFGIYGAPAAAGTYTITCNAYDSYESYVQVDFILNVLSNTDGNVLWSTDYEDGYGIEDYIGQQSCCGRFELGELDQGDGELFVSSGSMEVFANLWINGNIVSPEYYTVSSGSTRTVLSEELLRSEYMTENGPNTIVLEFNTGSTLDPYPIKTTGQNTYIATSAPVTPTVTAAPVVTATPAPTVTATPMATTTPTAPTATPVPTETQKAIVQEEEAVKVVPVETGDETDMTLWMALGLVSLGSIWMGIRSLRRSR